MAVRTIVSLVAALLAVAAPALHADVGERLDVDIRLHVDPSLVSRHLTGRLKSETEAIWAPYGVRLSWIDEAGDADEPSNGVVLDASLERQFESRRQRNLPVVLGQVESIPAVSNRRAIRLSFDATAKVVATATKFRPATGGIVLSSELARALGRVLAHEIGHVLLGADHDPAGLMRASFRADELAEPNRTPYRLACGSADRLTGRVRALRGGRLRATPATAGRR